MFLIDSKSVPSSSPTGVPDLPILYVAFPSSSLNSGAPEFKEEDGKATYKIGKSGTPVGELEGTDFESIRNNKVSVTPLYWNMTKLDLIRGKLPNE